MVGECLANGLGLNLPEHREALNDMTELCTDCLVDGVSIVARVVVTKQVVGFVVNQIQSRTNDGEKSFMAAFMDSKCRSDGCREYLRIQNELCEKYDVLAHNNCDVLLDVMFLGVLPAFGRRSIGSKLVEYSVQLARELKNGCGLDRLPAVLREPATRLGCVSGLMASNYSKSIATRLGFVAHAEVFYDQLEFGGVKLQERIPDPLQRSLQLMSVSIAQ